MTEANLVFIRMLGWQSAATIFVATIAFFYAGKHSAVSALLGGFSVVTAASLASLIFVRNKNKQDAAAILVSLLLAEIVKLIFIFTCLFLVFKLYKSLVPSALIIGLMAAAILSGAAISKIVKK